MAEDTPPPDAVVVTQNSRRRHVVTSVSIAVVAALFIALLGYGLSLDQTTLPNALQDQPAKAFRAAWIQGHEFAPAAATSHFTLEDFKGQPVVLNFWASWCVSCREEAIELERFWKEHGQQVKVVGIAIQDETETAQRFAKYYGKTYILGLDEDGKAAIDYGVTGVPETFLIDRQGVIRHKVAGPITSTMLTQLLPKIL